jgi:hypothetical protein
MQAKEFCLATDFFSSVLAVVLDPSTSEHDLLLALFFLLFFLAIFYDFALTS